MVKLTAADSGDEYRASAPRLLRLAAVLDGVLTFYTPNTAALREALTLAGPTTGRSAWRKTYQAARAKLPKPPEHIQGVTVKASNGKLYTSPQPFHPVAAEELRKERPGDYGWLAAVPDRAERAKGFRTNLQPHITRGEATALARRKGWRAPQQAWRKKGAPGLHGGDLRDLP